MGFAEGLNAGASAASKWVGAYKQGREWSKENDLRETQENAQKAWDERKSAIDADTTMTDHDKRQAHAEARGQYYDTLQSKYEHYGMGEQFNNMINAAGNARKESRANMLDMDQRAAYQQELGAQQVNQRKMFASTIEAARNGDKNALEKLNDIADYSGVSMTMKDGQFMWSPKGSDAAPVPMDMNRALEAYTAFDSFESRIRNRLQAEALLAGDAAKLDAHEGKKEAIATSKVARQKALADTVTYEGEGANRTRTVKDHTGRVKSVTNRKGEDIHEFDSGNATQSLMESGENQEMVETVQDGLGTEGRKALGKPRTVRRGNEVFVSFNYKGKRVEKPYAVFAEYVNQMKSKGSAPATTGKQKRRAISEESY